MRLKYGFGQMSHKLDVGHDGALRGCHTVKFDSCNNL